MKKAFLPLVLIATLFSSCCEDSGDLFWNVILPDTPATPCDSTKASPYDSRFSVSGYLSNVQLTEGSNVLLSSPKGLYWYDMSAGFLIQKTESPVAGKAFSHTQAIYRHGDLAVAASGTGLAVFNVKTGAVVWERTLGDCDISLGVYGAGDQFFVVRKIMEPDGVSAEAVFAGNLHEPNRLEPLFTPSYSRTSNSWAGYGRVTAIAPYIGADGHTYVLTSFFETQTGTIALANFMGLYDATAKAWVYERQRVVGNLPKNSTGIQNMTLSGTSAYLAFEDKLIRWDLATGLVRDSIVLFNTSAYPSSNPSARNVWMNDRSIVVETTNNDVQVFDKTTHAKLYRTVGMTGSVRVDFASNRLFRIDGDLLDIYEIHTGKRIAAITAPCQPFSGQIAVWTDSQGMVQLAAARNDGNIYRYAAGK